MKKLTVNYSFTQFFYWTAICGGGTFATAYLMNKGMSSGVVGTILAIASLLAGVTQPLIASVPDRSRSFILPRVVEGLAALCGACYLLQLLPGLPIAVSGICYAVAVWGGGTLASLVNALFVAYDRAGYAVNYGIGRGIGAVATALSALVLGYMIRSLPEKWMLLFLAAAWLLFTGSIAFYPRIEKPAHQSKADESVSVIGFFRRYPRFCATIAGILFLSMIHNTLETYMVAIMTSLGGDSAHAGTALFISAIVTFPVVCLYGRVRKLLREKAILRIAAVSYLVKAVCFYCAGSVTAICLFQLLQIMSYALLEPAQVYYAKENVLPGDMAKGQAFTAAAWTLGSSAGSFAGGMLLLNGTKPLLMAAIGMALVGMTLIFITTGKRTHR